jgi:riboflavin kinase/FMN adenylyltransferase
VTQIVSVSDLASTGENESGRPEFTGRGIPEHCRGGAISIGNFDGVHRGHAVLLSRVRAMADRLGGPAVAVTFDPHPARLLRPQSAPTRLTSIPLRAQRMSDLGIDTLVVCQTTPDLLNLSAEDFFARLVCSQLSAKGIVEGPNFLFGKNRLGDIDTLRRLANDSNREIEIVNPELTGDQMVSSSLIRHCIAEGDVAKAAKLCGHRHQISGIVTPGVQRGRQIGFPTANLEQIDVFVPKPGVYAGWAWLSSMDRQRFPAAIHIGPNPTFDDDAAVKVEIHLIDYDGDLYGRSLQVELVDRIRDVQRFDSPDQLRQQLHKDIQLARDLTSN